MERNSGLRRVPVSGFNGLQRRRSVRDSREEVELKDRDQLNRNDRDRDLIRKRRRVVESCRRNESDDESSDEEEMESLKIHQKNNQSLSIHSNRRTSLRTLRSSPVLRTAVDELIGVPIPRKARSASTKRLHEQFNRRRFSMESPIGVGCFSPSTSSGGSSMKKKMKSVEPRLRNNNESDSVIQEDIEFEVAEALFDLMKQSQSPKNSIDDPKRLKAFSVQNEQSIEVGGETVTVDPVEEEMNVKEISEKEKLSDDDKVEELLGSDVFLSKGKVKVNACRFQDQTVTKLDCGSGYVGTNKEAKFDVGLMGPSLKLCASSGKEFSVDAASNSKVTSLDVTERHENISKQQEKIETARSSQLANLDLEKYAHGVAVRDESKQQPWGLKEQKSQSSNSLLPFPIPMNGWHGVLPHPGYMTPLQALAVDRNVRPTISVQTQFKFSQPRSKRSTTHHHIALSIQSHHQLIKKSLSSGFTGASNLNSSKQSNLNLESTELKFAPEKLLLGDHNGGSNNKSSEVAKAMKTSTTLAQQATDQFPASKLFGPALILPFGHNQSASAVNNASLPSNSALNLPAMSFNQQNMAILQKNGSPFPILPNIALQKNGIQVPALPFFNSSLYSSPAFDVSQNQQHSSLPQTSLVQSTSQNTSSGSSSRKPPRGQKQTGPNDNKSTPETIKNSLIPSNSQLFSVPIQPMNGVVTKNRDSQQKGYQAFALSFGSNPSTNASLNFQMLPDLPRDSYQKFFQASESKSTVGSANLENGLKGIFEKIPESNGAQSHDFTKSADISASMFDGLARNMNIVTSSPPGNSVTIPNFSQHHQQLIQLQKHHMQLNGVKDPIFSSLQWDNLPQQVKSSQGQTHISFGNMPVSSASFQGRNIDSQYNSSLPKNVTGNLRNASSSSSALSSHQVDVSQSVPGQKSSPACRRNVPSILSTCTSQPSELKN